MLSFGKWVREQRQKYGWNLTSAASNTGVDASTLSRIENERTQATLDTALRICEGFEVQFVDLILDLVGKEIIETIQMESNDGIEHIVNVLDLFNLDRFLILFGQDPKKGCKILGELLQIATIYEQRNSELKIMSFSENDIYRLLLPNPIYHAELAYPSDYRAQEVLQTYYNDGVVTLNDVGIYLRFRRIQSNKTLANIEGSTKRSASLLSRIEGGELGRIKLQTALNLNEELGSDKNEILGMFWAAAEYQSMVSQHSFQIDGRDVQASAVSEALVTISRWLQVQNKSVEWIEYLSDQLSS